MALRDILVSFNVVVNQQQLLDTQKNVSKLISQFNGLARIAQFALAAIGVGKLAAAADEYIGMENKLKAVTDSTEEFVTAQRGVERIADDLMQPVSDITDAYLRYSLATESLGESQENVLDFTKRVTQAMILSGATAEEAHRAAVQLAQGFGKNFKAAAQDLKSVKEQAPVLARIIEKAAGALPGQLLVAAKAGKVTSRLVFDAVREAGEELDRDFTKRQKRFEDVSNLLGNQWMRLVKLLKPAFVPIINMLESMVHWIGEWVKDGSALNSVIAGAIVAVGALAYVFGGLAAAVAAAAAPFVALFVALEDFVAFIRGDESKIEEWLDKAFGVEATEKIRVAVQKIVALIDNVFAAFGNDEAMLKAVAKFEAAAKAAIDVVWAYAREKFRNMFRDATDTHPTGPVAQTSEDVRQFRKEHPIANWLADVTGLKEDVRSAREAAGYDSYTGQPLAAPSIETVAPNWEPPPNLAGPSSYSSPYGNSNMSPVINNNITVNGNADGNVSRDIATRQGAATSQALGRDRSAVGANFGAGQ